MITNKQDYENYGYGDKTLIGKNVAWNMDGKWSEDFAVSETEPGN